MKRNCLLVAMLVLMASIISTSVFGGVPQTLPTLGEEQLLTILPGDVALYLYKTPEVEKVWESPEGYTFVVIATSYNAAGELIFNNPTSPLSYEEILPYVAYTVKSAFGSPPTAEEKTRVIIIDLYVEKSEKV